MTGHNSMKMKDLSSLFSEIGLLNPETYIQSGNVLFDTDSGKTKSGISELITHAIRARFGYEIPSIIKTAGELRDLASSNPFQAEENYDPARIAVVFLTGEVSEIQRSRMEGINYPPDKYSIASNVIYIFCPNGFGKSKLYTNFFEGKMKVTGTARNLKTINNLIELAGKRQF